MARTHPHAEASYRVISLDNGSFGVEVRIPDTYPTRISQFATVAAAEAWIAEHRCRIEAQMEPRGWRRAPRIGGVSR